MHVYRDRPGPRNAAYTCSSARQLGSRENRTATSPFELASLGRRDHAGVERRRGYGVAHAAPYNDADLQSGTRQFGLRQIGSTVRNR
jgi:hypothetical protein